MGAGPVTGVLLRREFGHRHTHGVTSCIETDIQEGRPCDAEAEIGAMRP